MTGPRPGHAGPVRTLKSNSILIIMLPSSAPHFYTAPRAPPRGARFWRPAPRAPRRPCQPCMEQALSEPSGCIQCTRWYYIHIYIYITRRPHPASLAPRLGFLTGRVSARLTAKLDRCKRRAGWSRWRVRQAPRCAWRVAAAGAAPAGAPAAFAPCRVEVTPLTGQP
jgi:hypothetical protein